MDPTLLVILIAFQVNIRCGGCCFNNYNPHCSCAHQPITIPVRYMAMPLKGVQVIPISNGENGVNPSCPINICPQGCYGSPGGSGAPDSQGGPGGQGEYGLPNGPGGCNPPSGPGRYVPSCCPEGIDKCGYPSCIYCPRPGEQGYPECPEEPAIPGRPCGPGGPAGPGGPGGPAGPGGPDGPGGPSCPGGPGCPSGPSCPGESGGPEVPSGPGCPEFPRCSVISCCLSCPREFDYRECPSKSYCQEGCGGSIPINQNIPGTNRCGEDTDVNCYPLICKPCIPQPSPSPPPAPNPPNPDVPMPPCYVISSQNQDKYCRYPIIIQKDCTCDHASNEYPGLVNGNGNAPCSNMPDYSCSDVGPRPSPAPMPAPSPPYDCRDITRCCNYPNGIICGIQNGETDGYPSENPGGTPGDIPSYPQPNLNVPLCAKHYLVRSLRPVYDECIKKIPIIQKVVHHQPVTTVKTVPCIKRHVVSRPERYVYHVPVVEKLKICDYQYQTKMVPCKKTRVVPTVQTVVVSVPVTEKIDKPLYKEIIKHVPRVCYRMKPIVQENVIQIPVKEKSYRPVIVQRVVKVPVKSCIRKDFIEQKVHKSYCPCECC